MGDFAGEVWGKNANMVQGKIKDGGKERCQVFRHSRFDPLARRVNLDSFLNFPVIPLSLGKPQKVFEFQVH